MSLPPGRPCFPHLHLKARLPALLHAEVVYELSCAATNEMDMWDAQDTASWGAALPVIQLQVLHPHVHAVATPVANNNDSAASPTATAANAADSASSAAAASPTAVASPTASAVSSAASAAPSSSAVLPPPPSLTPALAALRLSNVASRLTADCKPLLSRSGKGSLKFLLTPSPALLARQLALYPAGAPISHPFYLHLSIPGPHGQKILPALSGPHQLVAAAPKGSSASSASSAAAAAGAGLTNASGLVSHEKLSYVMGEHGVHHAIFVPLDDFGSAAPGGSSSSLVPRKPASVYSFPVSASNSAAPPAFIRFKEILGVNLGGRIWDCGLLLFAWLREGILARDPLYFHGKRVVEVGSGTGLVGVWLWAYVLLKNRQIAARAAAGPRRSSPPPAPPRTEFLLTDQDEAMDNLRENIATNLALLTDGARDHDNTLIECSTLNWGCEADHAALAIQPSAGREFDVVIASDVVFNPIYFTPLLESLRYVSGPRTTVLLAYRPRASDRKQDEVFFRALPAWGWNVRREAKYENVFMLILTRIDAASPQQQQQQQDAATTSKANTTAASVPIPATATAAAAASSAIASPSPPPAAPAAESAAAAPPSTDPAAPASAPLPAPVAVATTTDASAAVASSVASASSSAAAAPSAPSAAADSSSSSSSDVDPLAAVLTDHLRDLTLGAVQGEADGLANALADARTVGESRGKGMAGELGFYAGFLHALTQLQCAHPNAYSERVWARATKLRATLLSMPLVSSGFDPTRLDDGASIVQLRSSFKVMLAQMGLAQYFEQQLPNPQSISF